MSSLRRALLLAALCLPALPGHAADAPYTVEVWADAQFGPDGQLQELEVPDAARYPAAFVERVKRQFSQARIPPVTDEAGAPARFRTGVALFFQVQPGAQGAQVRVLESKVAPRPLKRYAASQPEGLVPDTTVFAKVECQVGTDGRCSEVRVLESSAGSPEALRRWASASIRGWQFEPQRVNDRPVPGLYATTLTLTTAPDAQPPDFREPRRIF